MDSPLPLHNRGRGRSELFEALYTWAPNHDGVLLYLTLCPPPDALADLRSVAPAGGSNLDAHHDRELRSQMRMLLSFQRPPSLNQRVSFRGDRSDPAPRGACGPTKEYSAIALGSTSGSAGAQAPEAPAPHLEHLPVGPLCGHVVL